MGVFRKLLLLLPVLAAATASSPSALHALHNSAPPTPEALANSQRARQALDAATDIAQQLVFWLFFSYCTEKTMFPFPFTVNGI